MNAAFDFEVSQVMADFDFAKTSEQLDSSTPYSLQVKRVMSYWLFQHPTRVDALFVVA